MRRSYRNCPLCFTKGAYRYVDEREHELLLVPTVKCKNCGQWRVVKVREYFSYDWQNRLLDPVPDAPEPKPKAQSERSKYPWQRRGAGSYIYTPPRNPAPAVDFGAILDEIIGEQNDAER